MQLEGPRLVFLPLEDRLVPIRSTGVVALGGDRVCDGSPPLVDALPLLGILTGSAGEEDEEGQEVPRGGSSHEGRTISKREFPGPRSLFRGVGPEPESTGISRHMII